MHQAPHGDFDALLLDLGGVLIEIDWQRAFASWAASAGTSAEDVGARFRFDTAYAALERGEIGAAEYFAALRRMLGIALPDARFLAGWNAIFSGEIAGARELLHAAAARWPIYVFSNTCEVHRELWQPRFAELLRPVRAVFLSCRIGLRKPDAQAFAHVARAIGVAPGRIAFFDDTQRNVAGARDAGMRARRARSPAQIAAALGLGARG